MTVKKDKDVIDAEFKDLSSMERARQLVKAPVGPKSVSPGVSNGRQLLSSEASKLDSMKAKLEIRREEKAIDNAAYLKRQQIKAVTQIFGLLMRGGHVWLTERDTDLEIKKRDAETRNHLERIDAETAHALKIIERELQDTRESRHEVAKVIDKVIALDGKISPETSMLLKAALDALVALVTKKNG